jgi:hypothetical protein
MVFIMSLMSSVIFKNPSTKQIVGHFNGPIINFQPYANITMQTREYTTMSKMTGKQRYRIEKNKDRLVCILQLEWILHITPLTDPTCCADPPPSKIWRDAQPEDITVGDYQNDNP